PAGSLERSGAEVAAERGDARGIRRVRGGRVAVAEARDVREQRLDRARGARAARRGRRVLEQRMREQARQRVIEPPRLGIECALFLEQLEQVVELLARAPLQRRHGDFDERELQRRIELVELARERADARRALDAELALEQRELPPPRVAAVREREREHEQ